METKQIENEYARWVEYATGDQEVVNELIQPESVKFTDSGSMQK